MIHVECVAHIAKAVITELMNFLREVNSRSTFSDTLGKTKLA
jgi:hypothetical protein